MVDDEPDIHALMQLSLQDIRFQGRSLQILDASSAAEAEALIATHPNIALILLERAALASRQYFGYHAHGV